MNFPKKKNVYFVLVVIVGVTLSLSAKKNCTLPKSLLPVAQELPLSKWKKYPDLRKNVQAIKNLCVYRVSFREGRLPWEMLLLFNPRQPKGPFWFVPHDDENSAFASGVYAVRRYGGGMLSVVAGGRRYFRGQDPNRNFGTTQADARQCRGQKSPAPIYTRTIFSIIDAFRSGTPYLALHNNSDGYSGNGGSGTISVLRSTKRSQAYPAFPKIVRGNGGLKDEDTMIYIAGRAARASRSKVNRLNRQGINVKYEWVDSAHNDCSMSNYVILRKGTDRYYNIETQKGDRRTQRELIDRLVRIW